MLSRRLGHVQYTWRDGPQEININCTQLSRLKLLDVLHGALIGRFGALILVREPPLGETLLAHLPVGLLRVEIEASGQT